MGKRGLKTGAKVKRGRKLLTHMKSRELRLKITRAYAEIAREPRSSLGCESILKRIAAETGVSMPTVSKHLKAMRLEWQELTVEAADAAKAAMLVRLARIEQEAWDEWNAGKAGTVEIIDREMIEEKTADGKVMHRPVGRAKVRIGRPDRGLLETLRGVEADRRKLHGLDAPAKVVVSEGDLDAAIDRELKRLRDPERDSQENSPDRQDETAHTR